MTETETEVSAAPEIAAEAPTPSSADAPNTLGAEVDAMFGYSAPARETPAGDDDAPPASPPSSDTTQATGDTTGLLGAETSPASQPTSEIAAQQPDDDPLKDATPFTYTVNGESRTDDRIKVLKDFGAVIDAADLPQIQQRFAERDALETAMHGEREKLSSLEALTSWPQRDAHNRVVGTLTGREAIETARLDYGNALAKIEAYEALLADPARLASYLMVDQAKGEWGIDPAAHQQLLMSIENRQLKLAPAIRQHLASLGTPKTATSPTAAPESAAPSVDAAAAVEQAIRHGQITGLTDDDKKWAAEIVPNYVRQATAEDVRSYPELTVGQNILDPKFLALVGRVGQLRADAAKQVTAASTAAANNAPKLAAALAGRATQRPAPQTPTRQPTLQGDDALSPEEEAYLRFERSGAAALRARSA